VLCKAVSHCSTWCISSSRCSSATPYNSLLHDMLLLLLLLLQTTTISDSTQNFIHTQYILALDRCNQLEEELCEDEVYSEKLLEVAEYISDISEAQ